MENSKLEKIVYERSYGDYRYHQSRELANTINELLRKHYRAMLDNGESIENADDEIEIISQNIGDI
jgi:hypothetical protein